ncbi:MAG TPA: 3-hydroxyacyl-CoA dehydrogenase NAD-binding domain-containing protein, partial [Bdellovibrio sp.]|nr:3-hydroxyacyl-CoA dehydrogenase NAD-binding domain-containing protein [Bdellovibrio sp.]
MGTSENQTINTIKSIGIIGAGQMGNGIAQVAAQFGFNVVMMDVSGAALEKGLATIAGSCDRLIKKNTMSEADKAALLGRIKTAQDVNGLKECDVVIEAATENIDLKLKIFKDLDAAAKPGALLVTNTSSISITKIAAVTKRPDKVAGMHFMNP